MMRPEGQLVFLLPDGAEVETACYGRLNVLAHAEMIELDLPQKCGGQAECGTCRIRVLDGECTPARGDEVDLMTRHRSRFSAGERLACRARPRGDVRVAVLALMPTDLRDVPEDPPA